MSPPTNILEEGLQSWLSGWLSKQRLATSFQVVPLAGDGSPRPFFRIRVGDKSFVLLSEPAWILSKDYPVHQAHLRKQGLPVPEFLAVEPKLGALLMEDLGDELLQTRILAQPEQRKDWMIGAVRLLAHLHGSTFPVDPTLPVASRSFDATKYKEELGFTLEHLCRGLLNLEPPQGLSESIASFSEGLGAIRPAVFCHRDYHTRNILIHDEQLRLIDFQDARTGPVEYDLASLFFDAYVPLSEEERASLLALYQKELSVFPLAKQIDWKALPERLDRVAFQRVVKAAGSFASFYTRYGKRTHFPYLLPALQMAQELQKKLVDKAPPFPLAEWIRKVQEGLP